MKVLIADKFEAIGLRRLAALGCEIAHRPDLSADTLAAAVADEQAEVLIVRSTKVGAEAIEASAHLGLIIRAGAGYDTIDVAAASADGIYVANCPGKNAIAVAELAFGLILACDRRLPDQSADLERGVWNKKAYSEARGLYGRTLGVLGLGTIGLEVARRGEAFGMRVVAWSRSLTDERAGELGLERAATPLELAAASDVVSVHVASTPDTARLVDREFFEAMKPGSYLVNTSRGAVVDEAALSWAVREKGLRAGLDVFQGEPGSSTGSFDCAIAREAGVYGTHHIGASTEQAQQAIALEAVRVVAEYAATGQVENCVNRARRSPAICQLTVRHRNRPGVLAHVFQILSEAKINIEEMENVLYEGAAACCARIQLDKRPSDDELARIQSGCDDILGLDLTHIAREGEQP